MNASYTSYDAIVFVHVCGILLLRFYLMYILKSVMHVS